jgi:hypothetical protein
MARQDGMHRRELIFLHSASADGCNAWPTLPFPLAPIYAIARTDSTRVTQTTRPDEGSARP